jgi:hypothetical protein
MHCGSHYSVKSLYQSSGRFAFVWATGVCNCWFVFLHASVRVMRVLTVKWMRCVAVLPEAHGMLGAWLAGVGVASHSLTSRVWRWLTTVLSALKQAHTVA